MSDLRWFEITWVDDRGRVHDTQASGSTPEEARRYVQRRYGVPFSLIEEVRETKGSDMTEKPTLTRADEFTVDTIASRAIEELIAKPFAAHLTDDQLDMLEGEIAHLILDALRS